MLVHICCSVDSHYFLKKMQELMPKEKVLGYFYNPNIHPIAEYNLRLIDVTRSCDMLHIPLIVGEYSYINWYEKTKFLAHEPEKGKRCDLCFNERLEETAKKAKELGVKKITTTLLTSPQKSLEQLQKSGEKIAKEYGVEFVMLDMKKDGGTHEQNRLAKVDKLYRQNYCGCIYALDKQRASKQKPSFELFESLEYRDEPNTFGYKTKLYEERLHLEATGVEYEIIKKKRLNYRLLSGYVKDSKEIIPSFILPYSVIENRYSRGRVEKVMANIAYFNRDEIKFCDISYFNTVARTNFYSVTQLIRAKLSFEMLMKVRFHMVGEYDLSPIIVTNSIPTQKLQVDINAECFLDSVEELKPHEYY